MSLWRRRAGLGLALLLLAAGALFVSPATAVDRVRGVLFSPWFPVVLLSLYALRPFLAWPITALSALVGYRYGLALGFPVAMVGLVATSLVPFVAARRFRAESGVLGRVTDGSERFFEATGDVRGVVVARLAPTPAEAVSAAAGVANVSPAAFVLGTVVGELPWTVAAVLAGSSMHRFSPTGVGALLDPRLFAAAAAVAAALLAGPAYRYFRTAGARPAERG